jgi:hypothetical protein
VTVCVLGNGMHGLDRNPGYSVSDIVTRGVVSGLVCGLESTAL